MKILFTDLDGTLLNKEKKISSDDLEAIARASRQGNITVISTGVPFLPHARILISWLLSRSNATLLFIMAD